MTKGSAVYFHNERLVNLLQEHGYHVTFICTPGAASRYPAIPGCVYVESDLQLKGGLFVEKIVSATRYARKLYFSRDPRNFRRNFSAELRTFSWYKFISFFLASLFGWFHWLTRGAYFVESKMLYTFLESQIVNKASFDVLLIGGMGLKNSIADGYITFVARKCGIRTINAIINYDALTAKGFRGCPVENLVVWGRRMFQDAIELHAIPRDRVHELGSLRYNLVRTIDDRGAFFKEQRLNCSNKTIFFCGSAYPPHYIEMLKIYDLIKEELAEIQMVIRPYPSKGFVESAFMEYLQELIRVRDGIIINNSMPNRTENANNEFLTLDDVTYWNFVRYSDVVVNFYSSVTIDSLIFEKPIICLDYSPDTEVSHGRGTFSNLASLYIHHHRCSEYDVVRYAQSRESFISHLRNILGSSFQPPDYKKFKLDECGPVGQEVVFKFLDLLDDRGKY